MEVERALSVDEIFEKVQEYDLVFTAEASLKDALNNRLEEPVLSHFATTPMIYVLSNYQNQELLQERGLFHEVVDNTDLSWKQGSYLLENILDCWREQGYPEAILEYDNFDNDAVEEILEVIDSTDNIFSRMQDFEIGEERDVAVVNFHQFDEIDKQVLPDEFDKVGVFTAKEKEMPEFKIYSSTTEIIRAVKQNVTRENAQDVAIVNDRSSSYATLIESALQSKGIPMMVQKGISDDNGLRTALKFLRLGLKDRVRVRECQPVIREMGMNIPVEFNNDFLETVEHEDAESFKQMLDSVPGSTFSEVLGKVQDLLDVDLRDDFSDIGLLEEKVSDESLNRLEYYLDTYDVKKDSNGHGVLLADAKSSAYVDRPIVFYLGMDSDWNPTGSDRPWVDRESREETSLKDFKVLIQNGEQQHFLVQDKVMNKDVTPCLYFNDIAGEEFETFRDLPHESYSTGSVPTQGGFDREEYSVETEDLRLFSKSSLDSFVKCPKEYLFNNIVDSPKTEHFEKGEALHDFAEFYVNHPEFVKEKGKGEFVEGLMEKMKPVTDENDMEKLQVEMEVGVRNIIEFIDGKEIRETELEGYERRGWDRNFLAEKYGRAIKDDMAEAWFENEDLGIKGKIDLIASGRELIDYKSGKKTPRTKDIIRNSDPDSLTEKPSFQAMLYLTQLRNSNPGEKLEFVFFHFLSNLDDEMSSGEPDPEDNIVTVKYYPGSMSDIAGSREVFEYLKDCSNNKRKTLEFLGYEKYREFFEDRELESVESKKEIVETDTAEEFREYCREHAKDVKYVRKNAVKMFKDLVDFRREAYFREDIDRFEEFVQGQLGLLNRFREEGFPLKNPDNPDIEIDLQGRRMNHGDLIIDE